MIFGFFGRDNRDDSPRREKKPILTYEDKVREAIRFIVSSGFIVSNSGNVHRIIDIQSVAKTSPEQSIKSSVRLTTEALKGRDLHYITARVKEVTEILATDKLMAELTEEIIGEAVDAVRGRALVKGFRAGLDKSEAYLKLMDAKTVREVETIERWIERSNAYQAVTGA